MGDIPCADPQPLRGQLQAVVGLDGGDAHMARAGRPVELTGRGHRTGLRRQALPSGPSPLSRRPLTELQVEHRVSEGDIYLPSGVTESDIRLMNRDWKLIGGRKKR